MGSENAAATMAAILERTGHISLAGSYLRDLTGRARRGEFSLGPVLMALLRANGHEAKRVWEYQDFSSEVDKTRDV